MSAPRPASTANMPAAGAQPAFTAKQVRVLTLAKGIIDSTGGHSLPLIIEGLRAAYNAGQLDFVAACLAIAYNISKNSEEMFQLVESSTPELFLIEGNRVDKDGNRIRHKVNATSARIAGQLMVKVSNHVKAEELKRTKGNTFDDTHVLGSAQNIALQKEAHDQYFAAYAALNQMQKEEIAKIAQAGYRAMEGV